MKHTPQSALDMINADVAKAIRSPVFEKAAEQAVQRFVQAGLDGLLERKHLDVKVKFSVDFDPKKGQFMAFLSGTF
jgi:hypothetical protein